MSARLRWWLHDLQPATAREVRRNVAGVMLIVVGVLMFAVAINVLTDIQEQPTEMVLGGMSK